MLSEIISEKFKESPIKFHPSLNVVIGDEKATNSIGKSSLLMVIDFVFGGNSLIEHNTDILEELGHHSYLFQFKFNGVSYFFKRGTYTPDLVYKCNENYAEESPLTLDDYKSILKALYGLGEVDLSFRSVISLYSRVWGKGNYDVKQPLHNHKNQLAEECIDNLLKLYGQYESIRLLSRKAKELSDEKSALRNAFKTKLIPKTTVKQYKENVDLLSKIDDEIKEIKNNLAKYAVNISEIVNREVSELKSKKDSLLRERSKVSLRLNRVRSDLAQNSHIKSKTFSSLIKFFPEVNQGRISEVEEFHSKITKILKKELQDSEKDLAGALGLIDASINELDETLAKVFVNLEKPDIIVDRVHELATVRSSAHAEIHYYESDDRVDQSLKDVKKNLAIEKARVLKFVQDIVNNKIKSYVSMVYSEARRSPLLELSQKSYTFTAIEDTGTGKAYSNLILFDLAVFETTRLPIIIHDSFLFKNIENNAVAKMMEVYLSNKKQSFIAIDEIAKYGADAEKKLLANKVIQLSNDKVLYFKDWRK